MSNVLWSQGQSMRSPSIARCGFQPSDTDSITVYILVVPWTRQDRSFALKSLILKPPETGALTAATLQIGLSSSQRLQSLDSCLLEERLPRS